MRAFLPSILFGVAAIGAVSSLARVGPDRRLLAALPHPDDVKIAQGVEALTGSHLYRLFPEFMGVAQKATTHSHSDEGSPQPIPRYGLDVKTRQNAYSVPVRPILAKPVIVEAWGDDNGATFVRLADGSTFRQLASGSLVPVQPSNGPDLASFSSAL